MSTGKASGISKIAKEKNQRILFELVQQPGNDVCADCKANAPRWASYNLGIFICVHCASIHRKIGTHITKVKSLTLDDWSKEQVENMKAIGNVKSNQYWNPDERKHPLPTNMEESERDSEIERYIRSKYEFQRFRPLSTRASEKLGPSQSLQSRSPALPSSQSQSAVAGSLPKRSQTAPIHSHSEPSSSVQSALPPLPRAPALEARSFSSGSGSISAGANVGIPPRRSSFNPFPASGSISVSIPIQASAPAPPPNQQASLTSSTFNDLISIQAPSLNSSLPLQYTSATGTGQQTPQSFQTPTTTFMTSPFGNSINGPSSTSTNPYANLSLAPTLTGVPALSDNGPFSSANTGSTLRSVTLPSNFTAFGQGQQSSLTAMPTGTPSVFQQQAFTGTPPIPNPNPVSNPFAQMQMQAQMQQYPGTPPANNTTTSPFFPQPVQQQPPFQSGVGAFQTSSPLSTQAQQAQQIFQGMAASGPGAGAPTTNPFTQWR